VAIGKSRLCEEEEKEGDEEEEEEEREEGEERRLKKCIYGDQDGFQILSVEVVEQRQHQ